MFMTYSIAHNQSDHHCPRNHHTHLLPPNHPETPPDLVDKLENKPHIRSTTDKSNIVNNSNTFGPFTDITTTPKGQQLIKAIILSLFFYLRIQV